MGKVQGKGRVVKGDDSDGPKWPAPVRVEIFFFLKKNLKLQRVMSRKTSEGEAEAVKEKRDRVGHPTADRPNSLPYYPRLWSSGTGVLSRDSLSQKGLRRGSSSHTYYSLWITCLPSRGGEMSDHEAGCLLGASCHCLGMSAGATSSSIQDGFAAR